MDVKKELATIKKAVDHQLLVYLDDVITEARKEDQLIASMMTYFKKTLLAGGKRVRPAMMQYGYMAAGKESDDVIVKASISIELMHAFLLMHDDIVDRDDYRHGLKTMHAYYRDHSKNLFSSERENEHFGVSTGIVMGDFVHTLGNDVLFSADLPPQNIINAMKKMQDVVGRTAVGEMQDVIIEFKGAATEEEILRMYENKTARYTFEGPLRLGAILAGADDAFCEELSAFAIPLGIAFQLQDDLLGIYGSQEKTGKPVGSDIAEGKITLLVARAYEKATREQKKQLDALLGNPHIAVGDCDVFRDIMKGTGAYDRVIADIEKYTQKAYDAAQQMDIPKQVKDFFCGLAVYLQNREY